MSDGTVVREIGMPRLSDSMEEATVTRWLKRPGDVVARGEELVEVETDKATVVYEAEEAGVLEEILVDEGATAALGAPIALPCAPRAARRPPGCAGSSHHGARYTARRRSVGCRFDGRPERGPRAGDARRPAARERPGCRPARDRRLGPGRPHRRQRCPRRAPAAPAAAPEPPAPELAAPEPRAPADAAQLTPPR